MSTYAIVILSYNHPELTARCIDSVLNVASPHTNLQPKIYVVHNGSLAKHKDVLIEKYPKITHLVMNENKGYSGGANFGLNQAFKTYTRVLFLTNDVEVLQLSEKAVSGFAAVKTLRRQTEAIDSIMGLVDLKTAHLSHLKEPKNDYVTDANFSYYIPGTAFWMDRATFQILEGFDETFHTYWEDVDFSYRALQKNIKLHSDTTTVLRHKIGKTCHKKDFYTYYLFQRNRRKFMKKHGLCTMIFQFRFYRDVILKSRDRWKTAWKILQES